MKETLDNYRTSLWLKAMAVVPFGLVALCYPGQQIQALIFPFGVLVFLSGSITVLRNLQRGQLAMRMKGGAEALIGATVLATAAMSASVFIALIALWLVMTGSIMAIRFNKIKARFLNWQIMVIAGFSAVAFGLFVAISLVLEPISLTYEIAIFALLLGGSMFYACNKLKEIDWTTERHAHKDVSVLS